MNITYVTRSFLDYRSPVIAALDEIGGGAVRFIFSHKWTPRRAIERARTVLGERAICLTGERSIGVDVPLEANTSFCVPYQPGLLHAIKATRPDVVVGDGFFQWTYSALLQRMAGGTPLVICYERWAHTERNAQWYRRLYRRMALKFTDAVSCNGRLSLEYIRALGFPAERITTGHMAADTESLAEQVEKMRKQETESREHKTQDRDQESEIGNRKPEVRNQETELSTLNSQPSTSNGPIFLYVGQLIRRKGVAELLRAWGEFQRGDRRGEVGEGSGQRGECTLVVVGSGPEEKALKKQCAEWRGNIGEGRGERGEGKGQNVRFVGGVDYSEIARHYAAADVLVMPTLEDNWSLVVPEAMAGGLPVLCSKYNGCWPELVQEGRNGWVFDPLDTADTVRVLEACLRASETPAPSVSAFPPSPLPAPRSLLQAMGQESREMVKDHTPRRAAEAIYKACEIALARRKSV